MTATTTGPAGEYHRATSYDRATLSGRALDWGAQPDPLKRYPGRTSFPLPPLARSSGPSLLEALSGHVPREPSAQAALGRLLALAYGVTARSARGDTLFRAAASAGALYPSELYVATGGEGDGAPAGLYHYGSARHALTLLRDGDLTDGAGPAFVLSAVFFRSSWKYGRRAYRYHLLDTGHLAEGLALAGAEAGDPLELFADHDEDALAAALSIDPDREAPLLVVRRTGAPPLRVPPGLSADPGLAAASVVSARERREAEILAVHDAARHPLRGGAPSASEPSAVGLRAVGAPRPLAPSPSERGFLPLAEAVVARRSLRAYEAGGGLDRDRLDSLLWALAEQPGVPEPPWSRSVHLAVLAGVGVEGLEPGLHLVDRRERTVALVRRGDLHRPMAAACLDQRWLAAAPVHLLLVGDLDAVDRDGPRAYRHAMLTAGRLGQRAYVAATALGLGACGIGALYDDEAARLVGLEGGGRLLYLVAAGPPRTARRARPID